MYSTLDCLQKSAAQHLSRLSGAIGPERIYADWQWWILAALPFPHLVRVLDCFFHEGIKVNHSFTPSLLEFSTENCQIRKVFSP
jgi:TBC1 domain family member 24